MPRTGVNKQPVVILNKTGGISSATEGTILKSGANIGFIDAKNKIQTVSSDSATNQTKVILHNVMITCKNDNRFLDLVAIKMLRSLAKLPYVNYAAYYSYGNKPESELSQPDVLIALEIPELIEDKFLLSRQMQVKIDCVASSPVSVTLSNSGNNISSGSTVPFIIKSELASVSRTLCIECPGMEYEQEVKNISHELTEAIRKQFDNLQRKYTDSCFVANFAE